MKAIGGYFELEINKCKNKKLDHFKYYAVNSCRNALLLLIQNKKYTKVHLPYYTCGVIVDILVKNSIDIEYYQINNNLEIVEFPIKNSEVIVYNNYFGLKDRYIYDLSLKNTNLIIDNAQAFFSAPINNLDTIYSPRKFFGIPDGGYLYTTINIELESYLQDESYDRCSHLLKRVDLSPEEGYKDFLLNDDKLNGLPICRMSTLSSLLLSQIEYINVEKKRKENFNYLHKDLIEFNELNIDLNLEAVPMVYPLLIKNGKDLKKTLIKNRVFVATYWPDVLERVNRNSFENYLVNNLIPIPIDQRYDKGDMDLILEKIKFYD